MSRTESRKRAEKNTRTRKWLLFKVPERAKTKQGSKRVKKADEGKAEDKERARVTRLHKTLQKNLKKIREFEKTCLAACRATSKKRSGDRYDKYHHARKKPKKMSAETKAKIKQYWADRRFKIANNLPLAFAKPRKGHIGRR